MGNYIYLRGSLFSMYIIGLKELVIQHCPCAYDTAHIYKFNVIHKGAT